MVERYPLALSSWNEEELGILKNLSLETRMTMSEKTEAFEQAVAQKFGSSYCLMVNSGSSANLLALASLFFKEDNPLKAGDEVIVPALSWSTSYYPLQQYGLKVRFVDIDAETLNIDTGALREAISDRTRLVLAVNILGNPCQYDDIRKICAEHDLLLLEDNCEAMGARFEGKSTGTFGLLGTFSTYFSHHISTIEGGMVITDDEELFHIMLSLRSHGWTRSLPGKNRLVTKSERAFDEAFRFILPGYNLRPSEIGGMLGLSQLSRLDDFIESRKKNADYFCSRFENHALVQIQKTIGESSWFGFSILLCGEAEGLRNELCDFLLDKQIENRPVVAGNFTKNEVIQYFDYDVCGTLDSTNRVDEHGFYLGNHHCPIEEEIDYALESINSFLEQAL